VLDGHISLSGNSTDMLPLL